MWRHRIALVGFLVGCLFSGGDSISGTVEETLARIQAASRTVRTLKADFYQRKESSLFASAVVSKGRMIARPPDLLIWRVDEPLSSFFFVHQGTAGTRDPHTGQVKRFPMDRARTAPGGGYDWLLRAFMGSFGDLGEAFGIEAMEAPAGGRDLVHLRLVPKGSGAGKDLREVVLGFDRKGLYLREVVLQEVSGDRTEIHLHNVEVNGEIQAEIPEWLRKEGVR